MTAALGFVVLVFAIVVSAPLAVLLAWAAGAIVSAAAIVLLVSAINGAMGARSHGR